MSELKACPFCGGHIYAEEYPSGIDAHCTNKKCILYGKNLFCLTLDQLNTRPIEDALRADLATLTAERDAARAEVENLSELIQQVEQLRKSLSLVDDALNSYAEFYGRAAGLAGLSDDALPSTTTDEIILRKIAEHDEVERLRGIIRKAEFINAEFHGDGVLCDRCAICGVYAMDDGHTEDCPFYQWEGGAQ